MSTVYEIPLSPVPQTFSIVLGTVEYNFSIAWNTIAQLWILDILDVNNVPVVQGIPLVCSTDLLEQYSYLAFGGQLVVQTDNNPGADPTYENLGIDSHLYYVVP